MVILQPLKSNEFNLPITVLKDEYKTFLIVNSAAIPAPDKMYSAKGVKLSDKVVLAKEPI